MQHNPRDMEEAVRFLVGVSDHHAKLPYWPDEGYIAVFAAAHSKKNRQIAHVMDVRRPPPRTTPNPS